MFVNSPSWRSLLELTIEPATKDRLKTIVSCVALGILLVGVVYYWVSACFWGKHDVEPQSPKIGKNNLIPVFDNVHKPEKKKPKIPSKPKAPSSPIISPESPSPESPVASPKKSHNISKSPVDVPTPKNKTDKIEKVEPSKSVAVKLPDLSAKNDVLSAQISQAQPHTAEPIGDAIALQTHVHHISDNLYLGNYRGFLSIDPAFIKKYSMVDNAASMIDTFKLYRPGLSSAVYMDLYETYKKAAQDGSSKLNIKHVISVTNFKPGKDVEPDDWSLFEPNLDALGVTRLRIPVDDDKFAWDAIVPHLPAIREKINNARKNNENVLIHCVEGKSRSVTILLDYLMNEFGHSYDQTLNFIQSKRPQADPKPSFANGLKAHHAANKSKKPAVAAILAPAAAAPTSLDSKNLALAAEIKKAKDPSLDTKKIDPIERLIALQTHVDPIFENLFLGDHSSYLSLDPAYRKQFPLTDTKKNMQESFVKSKPGLTLSEYETWYEVYQQRVQDGCANLGIQHVIHIGQYTKGYHASYKPNLDPSINIVEVPVDENDFSWATYLPHRKMIHDAIDKIRLDGKPCLIRCKDGKVKSVGVLIDYLMERCGVTYDQALLFLQTKRPEVRPKASLSDAIKAYHASKP